MTQQNTENTTTPQHTAIHIEEALETKSTTLQSPFISFRLFFFTPSLGGLLGTTSLPFDLKD